MKYRDCIYQDIKNYFDENYEMNVNEEEIDMMTFEEVLRYYLEWNGIIGYTREIIDILQSNLFQ